jgi:hypothetical protein
MTNPGKTPPSKLTIANKPAIEGRSEGRWPAPASESATGIDKSQKKAKAMRK